jgi:pimeloyl-ACP methyl ester carboxylesterase
MSNRWRHAGDCVAAEPKSAARLWRGVILKRAVRAADGRLLATQMYGDPDGKPVFLLHGTPGSRLGPHPRSAVLQRLGVCLISFDRPGYGESDRMPGRRVADAALDVETIADAYGLRRFAVVGRSGGGPHALACAALLPDRTTRAAVLVSVAQRATDDGLDWFDGMALSNVLEFSSAFNGYERIAAHTKTVADGIKADPASLIARLQAELPTPDRRVVADHGIRSKLVETYAEAMRTSDYGWIDDALAFCSPWGFDPAAVRVPVLLWHGANDVFSPASHARWLADRIPSATVIVQAGAAHFGALDMFPDILRWAIAAESRHLSQVRTAVGAETGSATWSRSENPTGTARRQDSATRGGPSSGGGSHDASRQTAPSGAPSSGTPPGSLPKFHLAAASPPQRYLHGQFPDYVPPGEVFSLLVSVVLRGDGQLLKEFHVPHGGLELLLVAHAPGFEVLSGLRQKIIVPPEGNSEPVMYELMAAAPGQRRISITAWDHGSYLGELVVEVAVRPGVVAPYNRISESAIRASRTDGEVTLVARYDPRQNAYRFEFRDLDNSPEVPSSPIYEPGPAIRRLLGRLDQIAEDGRGYTPDLARDYLINAGLELWEQLIPETLRRQFWERHGRIRQLTILSDRDDIPWELLYPKDPGCEAGFLVEQFPVTRAVFGCWPARSLNLQPARFVLPHNSPPRAVTEVESLRALLAPNQASTDVIHTLQPLLSLIRDADFGLLHFACHNNFDPVDGSSIRLDGPFEPTQLSLAGSDRALAATSPLIFINACRSAGKAPSYNRLDGWAEKFLRAGAGAFVGSLWAVRDSAARDFAEEVYRRLQAGHSLGDTFMAARQIAASNSGDPTWLAYAVYGNPQARIG